MEGLLPLAVLLILGIIAGPVHCADVDNNEDNVQLMVHPLGEIKQGMNFTMTCICKKCGLFDVFRIIRMTEDKLKQTKAVAIVTNGALDEKFKHEEGELQTYSVVADITANTQNVKLTIQNIQGEDGGDLGCQHNSKVNADTVTLTAMEVVTVYVPVNSVQIRQRVAGDDVFTPVADGATVVMRDGFEDEVQCFVEVKGSDPDIKPVVQFKIGEHNMKKDKADEHDTETRNPLDDDEKFRIPYYKTEYRYKTNKPDKEYSKKTITCAATMETYDKVTTTAVLDVQYPPSVNCRETYNTRIGEEFTMTCEADMNPGPTESYWTWGQGDEAQQLSTGDVHNGYEAIQTMDEETGKYLFSLKFSTMNTTYLGSYSFTLKNSLSDAIKSDIKLEEAEVTTTTSAPTSPPKSKEPKNPNTDETKSDPNDNALPMEGGSPIIHSSIVMPVLSLFCALLASRS